MSQSRFSNVAQAKIQRSKFNRSHNHKTTFDANYLVPVFVDEVLPGDTFNMSSTVFARLATPIKPSMDNLKMDVHFFFVPNRLVWDNWEKFMGAQDNPADSTDYLIPQRQLSWSAPEDHINSFYDYFGIPYVETATGTIGVNELPFRAYNLIWNEWYRDQNLQDSVDVDKGDTVDTAGYLLLKRGKRHDYFTSALPFPQKGEPVSLSLAGSAPVEGIPDAFPTFQTNGGDANLQLFGDVPSTTTPDTGAVNVGSPDANPGGIGQNLRWESPNLVAQLDDVTAVTINQLRQAFQLQKFLERDARSGTRYIEVIKAHFGVTNPDFRLQRPEYLGGCHENIRFTTIAQTTQTLAEGTPQGNLSAMATVAGKNRCFNKSFTEHGFIIGLASVYADLTYQQGLNRMWLRQTRVDHYWPVFAHLGEQEIFNAEIYTQGIPAEDNAIFGYQERFAEYRYHPDRISGEFRSSAPQSLDVWHYAEDFDALPVLNGSFIENNAPVKRNTAVNTEPDFIADFHFSLSSVRAMPLYGTPGFVDHF